MRFMLLRCTAVGTKRLLTVTPKRAQPNELGWEWIENQRLDWARCFNIREKPSLRVNRKRRENIRTFFGSHAKANASLCASGSNHCAPAFGFHTNQKTMGAFSFGY
jgi:hypothetical protein